MTGIACTSTIRATSCPNRTCRLIRGWRARRCVPDDIQPQDAGAAPGRRVPYTDDDIAKAPDELKGKTEEDAVIAYLQDLGLALRNVR